MGASTTKVKDQAEFLDSPRKSSPMIGTIDAGGKKLESKSSKHNNTTNSFSFSAIFPLQQHGFAEFLPFVWRKVAHKIDRFSRIRESARIIVRENRVYLNCLGKKRCVSRKRSLRWRRQWIHSQSVQRQRWETCCEICSLRECRTSETKYHGI